MNLYKTILKITLPALRSFCVAGCLCAFGVNIKLSAADAKLSIQPDCKTFYADRTHTFTITAKEAAGEALNWNLRYAGRTLAAGKQTIPNNGVLKINFEFPKLNEGVIAETEFSCFLGEKGPEGQKAKGIGDKALGTRHEALGSKTDAPAPSQTEIRRILYFFNPNPFEGQKKALQQAKIGIWETGGEDLSELLKSLEVPFAKVAAPEQFSGKVLLVAGLDFDKAPGAMEALLNLAEQEKEVIILPPITGKMPLHLNKLNRFILGGNEMIREIGTRHQALGIREEGKREGTRQQEALGTRNKFDTGNWNGQPINQSSFNLIPAGETIELELKEENKGFTYCELRKGKGKVIFITWDIINGAKVSPTPVYWLEGALGTRH